MTTQLWQRTASELALMIAGREVMSAEVVEAHLARIEAVNPRVNAIVRVLADGARALGFCNASHFWRWATVRWRRS
jgi:amidase